MMIYHALIFAVVLHSASVTGQQVDGLDVPCPLGSITMAGADGARRVIDAWRDSYAIKCPNVDVTTQGGGYAAGAARVCGDHIIYPNVDIAGMSGPFFQPQATTKDDWRYDCKKSDRNAILVSPWSIIRSMIHQSVCSLTNSYSIVFPMISKSYMWPTRV